MRGIQIKQLVKGPDDLEVSTLPDPTPGEDDYLISIEASATNFFDTLQITGSISPVPGDIKVDHAHFVNSNYLGKYQHQPPLPWISGSEFAGTILKAPSRLSNGKSPKYKAGDQVFGASMGGYATKIACDETRLRPVPKGWSPFEAAGLFVTMPTSYAGLVIRAGIKAGDYVLVHAAAGGVGLAAVQIAKGFGATVIATAGTKHKQDIAKRFGADYVVDYKQKDWTDKVKECTPDGRGVDIVYDPVGLIAQSMKCTAWNGRLLVIGFAAGELEKMATNRILLKNVSVVGLHWGMYAVNEPQTHENVWDGIFDLISAGKIKSTCFTDEEFVGLERVPAALKALSGRETWGKVVVKVPQEGQSRL